MHRMKKWALILSAAMLFGGGCGWGNWGNLGNSTIAITAIELFDIGLGVIAGTLLQGAGLNLAT